MARARDAEITADRWFTFVDEIAPLGWSVISFKKAREMHQRVLLQKTVSEARAQQERGTIYELSHKIDAMQCALLAEEIVRFAQTRPAPANLSYDDLKTLTEFLDKVNETYRVQVHMPYEKVYDAEYILKTLSRRTKGDGQRRRLRALEWINDAYKQLERGEAEMQHFYEREKRDIKRILPPYLQSLIDQVVEIFVYDPYRLGIEYIHRNHPGPIGAFYGLDEEE